MDRNGTIGGTVNRIFCMLAAALAVAASLLFTAAAGAHGVDRNRDGIPDRWEKQHHLSLKVKQTRLDQDRDGLNNLGEYRSGTDPRKADTDNDGIGDNSENAGTVASFTNGVLTVNLAKGGTLSGQVTDATEIECEGTATATSAGDDSGGDQGGRGSADGNYGGGSADGNDGAGNSGDDNGDNGDDDNGGQGNCGVTAFTAGRQVKEAELKASNGVAEFDKVQLGA
jgi:hypothetical protein